MYFVLCLASAPLLFWLLARPPRAREGTFLALAIPLLLLLAGVAWQNKQDDLALAGRSNVNAATAEALARACDVPLSLSQATVRWRDERAGGRFRSLGRIPSLGRADRADREAIARLARDARTPASAQHLRQIAHTGKVDDAPREDDRGLFPDLHRKWLAAQALNPGLSLAGSPRARILAVLGSGDVVDRVVQWRYLNPNREFDLPDVLAVPSQRIVLREGERVGRWLAWAVGLPLLLALGLHLLLRRRGPGWDEMLLPAFVTLGVVGAIVLFAVSRPLTDPTLPLFLPGLPFAEFVRQGLALSLALAAIAGWLLMPRASRRRAGELLHAAAERFWLWGALAFCLLAANLAAGTLRKLGILPGAAAVFVVAGAALFLWRRFRPAIFPAPGILAAGAVFVLLLLGARLQARGFGVLYIEGAKLALAVFMAAFAAAHDALLPDQLHHIPARAVGAALFWFGACLSLVLLTGDLGFLLLLWLPAGLLATIMLRRARPLLVSVGTVVAAGVLLYATAPLLQDALGWEVAFPDRWHMFRDPWNGVSDQTANALYRVASVPSVLAGTGLSRGEHPETSADVRDVILPFHFENLGAIGLAGVLALYLLLLYRMFAVGVGARDAFTRWFTLGSAAILSVQSAYTFAASANLLPLTGITAAPLASGASATIGMGVMVGAAMAAGAGEGRRPPQSLARAAGLVYALTGALLALTFFRFAHLALDGSGRVALATYRGPRKEARHENPRLGRAAGDLRPAQVLCRRDGLSWDEGNLVAIARSGSEEGDGVRRRYQEGLLGEALLPVVGLRTPYGWAEGGERAWSELLTGISSDDLSVLDPQERWWRAKKGLLESWRDTHHFFRTAFGREPPEALRLTLVASLQEEAYRRLRSYLREVDRARPLPGGQARRGVVAICDVRTGEYLAAAQAPSFEPNAALADWRELDRVLHEAPNVVADNLHGTLRAPGSVAKINTIAALLQAKPARRSHAYRCAPSATPGISCMGGVNHGWVTPSRILAVSCNRGAAQAARDAGWANLLAAYRRQKYRFADEKRARYGILRRAAAGSDDLRSPEADFRDYTRFIAFGQVLGASVDEVMRSACALANRGRLVSPHWRTAANVWEERVWRPEVAEMVSAYLARAAGPGGTAYRVWAGSTPRPSKTGSAQTGRAESDAWFVTYGPWGSSAQPRVALVLWAERVGSKTRLSEGTGSDMARRVGVKELMAAAEGIAAGP